MSEAVLTLKALTGHWDDTKGKKMRTVQRGERHERRREQETALMLLLAAAVHHESLN